jgi:hypothetical protein
MDRKRAAGERQEKEVAFQLRRGLDAKRYTVFHDLRLEHDGETAQIDHLVLHKYGFVIIESKSIAGEVKVNDHGEWSRSYNGAWSGMPSPIKQAELQQYILKNFLEKHKKQLLGKLIGLQKAFGGRAYDILAAISSSAIFHRDSAPAAISDMVVKTEFLPDRIHDITRKYGTALLSLDAQPAFSKLELETVAAFLRGVEGGSPNAPGIDPLPDPVPPAPSDSQQRPCNVEPTTVGALLSCRKCGATTGLKGAYGKFGYYISCAACNTNTSMKGPCTSCGSPKTRVSKKGNDYTRSCEGCGGSLLLGTY